MINLQSDIGPLYYARAILQSLRYIALRAGCQIVIISRLLAFGNGTNETACDARNVAHILDGGQRTLRDFSSYPDRQNTPSPHSTTITTHAPFSPTACAYVYSTVDLYCTHAHNMLRVYILYIYLR